MLRNNGTEAATGLSIGGATLGRDPRELLAEHGQSSPAKGALGRADATNSMRVYRDQLPEGVDVTLPTF
jgi:hypothetical protein